MRPSLLPGGGSRKKPGHGYRGGGRIRGQKGVGCTLKSGGQRQRGGLRAGRVKGIIFGGPKTLPALLINSCLGAHQPGEAKLGQDHSSVPLIHGTPCSVPSTPSPGFFFFFLIPGPSINESGLTLGPWFYLLFASSFSTWSGSSLPRYLENCVHR